MCLYGEYDCLMTRCCCCFDLQYGTYVSAFFTLVLSVISLLSAGLSIAREDGIVSLDQSGFPSYEGAVIIALYIALVLYASWFVASLLLIYGTNISSRYYLLPWILITLFLQVLSTAGFFSGLFTLGHVFNDALNTFQFFVYLCHMCFNPYMLICVCSYFRKDMDPGNPGLMISDYLNSSHAHYRW